MEEIEHGNKKASSPCFFFIEGDWRKWTKQTHIYHRTNTGKNHIENVPNPTPSFVELCIVSDPNLPGASLP